PPTIKRVLICGLPLPLYEPIQIRHPSILGRGSVYPRIRSSNFSWSTIPSIIGICSLYTYGVLDTDLVVMMVWSPFKAAENSEVDLTACWIVLARATKRPMNARRRTALLGRVALPVATIAVPIDVPTLMTKSVRAETRRM